MSNWAQFVVQAVCWFGILSVCYLLWGRGDE